VCVECIIGKQKKPILFNNTFYMAPGTVTQEGRMLFDIVTCMCVCVCPAPAAVASFP